MIDMRKTAIRMTKFWLKRCEQLGIDIEGVIAINSVSATNGVSAMNSVITNDGGKEGIVPSPEQVSEGEVIKRSYESLGNPSLKRVEAYAEVNGISKEFARAWYEDMNRKNDSMRWRHPKTGKILNHWQSYLLAFWKRRDEFDPLPPASEPKAEEPVAYTAYDWRLCAERCKFFDSAKCQCMRGRTVPPEKLEYPMPPEECGDFARLAEFKSWR